MVRANLCWILCLSLCESGFSWVLKKGGEWQNTAPMTSYPDRRDSVMTFDFKRWDGSGANHPKARKGKQPVAVTPLIFLVRLKGFEPLTHGLEVRCSIHLSYRRTLFPVCWGWDPSSPLPLQQPF